MSVVYLTEHAERYYKLCRQLDYLIEDQTLAFIENRDDDADQLTWEIVEMEEAIRAHKEALNEV